MTLKTVKKDTSNKQNRKKSNSQNPLKITKNHVLTPKLRSISAFAVFNMKDSIRCNNDTCLKSLSLVVI